MLRGAQISAVIPVECLRVRAASAQADPPAALSLYLQVVRAATLAAAAHGLVAAVASAHGFARVSLGLHRDGRTRLVASSNIDMPDPTAELPQLLTAAMDEAIEQATTLSWPGADADVAGGADVDLAAPADTIALAHQAWQRRLGGAVATVPLGHDGEPFGALCIERAEGAFGAAELAALEQTLLLALPALRWIDEATQPWHRRARNALLRAALALRQPEHRQRRRTLAALALALLFIALAPLEYGVSGRARIEGAEQRVLVAPTDGFVKTAHVRPGDQVRQGDALVDLLEGDLRLERERWASQLAQHENAYAAAMARSDRAGAGTGLARIGEAQAQLSLVDEQLQRGRVVAPFDALVIDGDLSQAIGAPVRQGDRLLTLASAGRHRVIVEIDETDIAAVVPGQPGRLSLSSLPWGGHDIVVERITPLAKAVDGRNIFEVQARLLVPQAGLRPGLLGRAEFAVGHQPPLWVWSRHALDRLRLTWWSWLG